MNKLKKVATAAVSIVMAGTMAGSFAACGGNGGGGGTYVPPVDGTVKVMEYASGTTVRTAIGYNSDATKATFTSSGTLPLEDANGNKDGTSIKLPDGKTYNKGSLKPIWQSYQTALDLKVSDVWPTPTGNSAQTMTDCVSNGLQNYDIIGAGSLKDIQGQVDAGTLLNLGQYMDYMPNLRQFLKENELAKLGTLADVDSGAVYYTPYYAGMNDAERYNLFRKDYVSELLDYADLSAAATKNGGTITFKAQADKKQSLELGNRGSNETYDGSKSSIESYMGQTGSYVIETTNPADKTKTVFVKVDYDAAQKAATTEGNALYTAIKNATVTEENTAGTAYSGTSGNIVDLQNFAIDQTGGEVKGEHLLNILREYIKVAYKWASTANASTWNNNFYGGTVNGKATKLGDIINETWAAWDVDIYAAIGRCFVTCGNLLGQYQSQASEYTNQGASTWLFVTRTGKLDRLTRQTAMIGELYGVRGMEKMTYLDSSGTFRQARFNVATWDAMQKFSAFHTEGLVPSFENATKADASVTGSNGNISIYDGTASHFQTLSSNDFIHTQAVLVGTEKAGSSYVQTHDGYIYTGVQTPVSRWLTTDTSTVSTTNGAITVDFNGKLSERPENKTTVMRFTESALVLKGGGLVVPKTTAKDKDKLGATLALLDYIYSNDGQIVTTFGEISTTDNLTGNDTDGYQTTNDGWWYGKEVTSLKKVGGGTITVTGKSMADLQGLGVVTTYDNGKQYVITEDYQDQALVYKNKLYTTGTQGGDYDNGYLYNGVMSPYYTRAVRKLCEGQLVNGYRHDGSAWSSTNLQNIITGAESHGIINNAGMVQLCNEQSLIGFGVISDTFANGTLQTVSNSLGNNPWYSVSPQTTLPKTSSDTINSYSDFSLLFDTAKTKTNYLFTEVAAYGAEANFGGFGTASDQTGDLSTPEGVVAYLRKIAPQYEVLNHAAWAELFDYYQTFMK